MWWTRLCVLCFLVGCGSGEDSAPKGAAGNEEVAEECVPSESCCKDCADSQACGDTCISRDNECTAEPGCACDAVDVCEEDSGDGG